MDRAGRPTSKRESGFTLIELMVVIVIIGLAAGAVMLAMPERGGSLRGEAERFAARAKAARDGAILEARAAAVRVGGDGYEVVRRSGGAWRGEAHYDWAEGTEPELAGGAGGSIRFDATGLADPARVVLRRGGRRVAIEIGNDGGIHVR